MIRSRWKGILMKISRLMMLGMMVTGLLLAGCGGDGRGDGGGDGDAGANMVKVTIEANDAMTYNKKLIEVDAGSMVQLTLKHVGTMPLTTMGHNCVILKPGTNLDNFTRAAASAMETSYIPPQRVDQIVAHTRMLGGGESDTITFPAPKKGNYKFICSFPGHYLSMQGDFIVR